MAKIYGTPIMAGGAGGANKDLPPLLDNFKAFKGGEITMDSSDGVKRTVGDLAVGDKIKVSVNADAQSFLGENIVFQVAAHNHPTHPENSATLITEKIIANLPYDARGDNFGASTNEQFQYSDLYQWLNSKATAGQWWSSKFDGDVAPSEGNVGINPYTDKAGFLNMLNTSFVGKLLQTHRENITSESTQYEFDTLCFLTSEKEVNAKGNSASTCLPIFTDNTSRIAYPTQECINNSEDDAALTSPESPFYWWKETVVDQNSASAEYVNLTGGFNVSVASRGLSSRGIRPACNISNSLPLVSDTPDEEGCYLVDWNKINVTIQADKMLESRANELAGAVWVYGDHELTSVNDGTKIQLSREEVIVPALETLESGSKVRLGTYNGEPLGWIVARDTVTQELRLVLDTDSVTDIGKIQYDAPESSNPDSNRQSNGNNKYSVSNAHQWLNSDGETGSWYVSAHQYDAAPDYAATKAGFLNEWDDESKSVLKTMEWPTVLPDVDGGGKEDVSAKVALLSTAELGLDDDTGGNQLDIFDSDEDRAVGALYYTRTPQGTSSDTVGRVYANGSAISWNAVRYSANVRPICAPNPSTPISGPDDEGYYTIGGEAIVKKTVQWDGEANFFARQFTYNSKKQYQTMREGAIAKIYSGQSITELPSGSKVKLGTWNDTPLQWKVARDTSDQSIRLVLEPTSVSLLGNKMWDNKEPSNSDSNRRSFGNNRYIYSNIHQWLNATKATGWYTAQHSADAAPAYSSSPGFLSGWSENHLNALDRPTLTVSRSDTDGGGTETFASRVALMSTTELGLESGTGNGRLDIFNSDGDRATGSNYWTRTPYPSNSGYVRRVHSAGTLYTNHGASSAYGVRPLCSPKSTTYVSLGPDSDGCYTITGVNE